MRIEINDLKFDLDERDSNPDRKDEVQRALLERFAATARSFESSFVGMDRKHERIRVQFDARPGVQLEDIHGWLNANGFVGFDIYAVS